MPAPAGPEAGDGRDAAPILPVVEDAPRVLAPALAIDVGGSKLAAGIVDGEGRLLVSRRVPTPVTADPAAVWAALETLVGAVRAEYGRPVAGAGVGCGGPMSWPAGEVSPLNLPAWRDFPLRAAVRDLLRAGRTSSRAPSRPVRLHNDAVCVAVGEHWRGAGRGSRDVLGMVVSTGVGGGLVLGDRLIDGASGNAGHIGHVLVQPADQPDSPLCGCGARGCLEAVARGPAVVGWAQRQGWVGEPTGVALAASAAGGNPVARAAFARAGRALGLGIASAVNLCDVSVVAIGGGLVGAGAPLLEPLAAAYAERARLPFSRRAQVVPARLGADAGLVGAAALVLCADRYWTVD